MSFKKRFEVEAMIVVPVRLIVAADNIVQARKRTHDGAWASVVKANWDRSRVESIIVEPVDVTVEGPDARD